MGQDFSREELISGPWDDDLEKHPEPELRDHFIHTISGYQCLIKRNVHQWTYCGYVQLPENHPDFHKSYFQLENELEVHGKLTFSENGNFGFDCFHMTLGDLSPVDTTLEKTENLPKIEPLFGQSPHYWTYEEVKKETEWLAQQFWIRRDK